MPTLRFAEDAAAALDALAADPGRKALWERVNDGLDMLESDPSDSRVRRHRFQDPPLWAFLVAGSGEEWIALWHEVADDVIVEYLGPSSF